MKKEFLSIYLNLDDIIVAKHVTKAIKHVTPGKLDKEEGIAIVKIV
jgi:hypothetical protein